MLHSPTTLQTDPVHRHFIESCGNTIITDDSTDGYNPSAFVGSSQLPTKSLTKGSNSKGQVLMHLCLCALADRITDRLRKI
jgi:hypothetical protein